MVDRLGSADWMDSHIITAYPYSWQTVDGMLEGVARPF